MNSLNEVIKVVHMKRIQPKCGMWKTSACCMTVIEFQNFSDIGLRYQEDRSHCFLYWSFEIIEKVCRQSL